MDLYVGLPCRALQNKHTIPLARVGALLLSTVSSGGALLLSTVPIVCVGAPQGPPEQPTPGEHPLRNRGTQGPSGTVSAHSPHPI